LVVEKSPDAFRTISEVADEIDVPQHVLRFWESRFSHIRPMKRGGGRRYYRPDDVDLLRGIRHLLYGEGYTIRGVQRILREHGGAFVQNVWRVGAEPPPPPLEEDAGELVAPPVEDRAEPTLLSGLGEKVGSAEGGIGSSEHRQKLKMALDELLACRRIIDGVLQ
jgi:DNA-binding transcriptional MerR regulator